MDLITTAELLGNFGEFIGSIAIVITLVYLAIQIRQSRHATTFSVLQVGRSERMAWFRSNRDSPYMPAIYEKKEAGETLTRQDEIRLISHAAALWGLIYSQWIHQQLGLGGKFTTLDAGMISMAITTPGAMDWWEQFGSTVYPAEFCTYVEAKTFGTASVGASNA